MPQVLPLQRWWWFMCSRPALKNVDIYVCTKTSSLDRMPTRIVHVQQRQPNFPCIGVSAARQWSEIICQKRSSSGISSANPLQHARFQATLHVDDNKLGPCIFVDSAHTKRDSCWTDDARGDVRSCSSQDALSNENGIGCLQNRRKQEEGTRGIQPKI